MIKISIIHPTARIAPPYPSFPTGWRESAEAFARAADNPQEVEYVLSVHESNWGKFLQLNAMYIVDNSDFQGFGKYRDFLGFHSLRVVKNTGRNCGVDQGNAACAAASGEIFMGSMDDLFPPAHWDTLVGGMLAPLIGRSAILHVRTGSPLDDQIFIPQISTKALFEQRGYAVHPSYESMFCDNEFTEHAKLDGIVIEAPHILFEHRHPVFGTAQMDEVYAGENRHQAYLDGQANFEYRKALGFPKESEPQHAPKKLWIALCLPGEVFNQEYLAGVLDIYGHLLVNLQMGVHIQLAHTSNVYVTRMQITEGVLGFNPLPDLWLWLDDDNRLTPAQLDLLLQDLMEHPELDAVVGWCWCDSGRLNDQWQMSCGHQDEQMKMLPFAKGELEQGPLVNVEWSGLPCALIRGRAMETLGADAFQPIVRPDVKFGFTSEDTAFWWHFRQAGFKVAVDLRVELPHMKYRIIKPVFVPELVEEEARKQHEVECTMGRDERVLERVLL